MTPVVSAISDFRESRTGCAPTKIAMPDPTLWAMP